MPSRPEHKYTKTAMNTSSIPENKREKILPLRSTRETPKSNNVAMMQTRKEPNFTKEHIVVLIIKNFDFFNKSNLAILKPSSICHPPIGRGIKDSSKSISGSLYILV